MQRTRLADSDESPKKVLTKTAQTATSSVDAERAVLTPKDRASKDRPSRQKQPAATRQAAYTKTNRADKDERTQKKGRVATGKPT
jgi:hypothetical protein